MPLAASTLCGLAVAVGERDQLFAAISANPDHHQQTQLVFLEADVDVDAIRPQIHIVHLGQITLAERALFSLPLLGELGDRRRQSLRTTQKLTQRRHKEAYSHAMN